MVKCPRCGYENSSSSTYCVNCMYVLSPDNRSASKNSKSRKGWDVGIAKKIVIVLGIIVIALLLFSFVNNSSQPDRNDTLNVVYDDGSHHQSSTYPFKAIIKYDGNWYAKMGNPNYLVEKSGTGTSSFSLDCAAWDDVEIDAERYGGEGELQIQLLRNGKVVAENSTADGLDSVKIYFDS